MNHDERRKVFWLLKKYSSYAAWQFLADAYYGFAAAWMRAMHLADKSDVDDFNVNATKYIMSGRIAFEKGLLRLQTGDRSVWRRSQERNLAAWGWLAQAAYQLSFVAKIMDPAEYVFDWMKNKNDVVAANDKLQDARFSQEVVLERMDGQPAPLACWNALTLYHLVYGIPMHDPKHLNFPVHLAEVPQATMVTVGSDLMVPFDGIYEPVFGKEGEVSDSGLLEKIKSLVAVKFDGSEGSSYGSVGCMNYLLAHSKAPRYRKEELGQSVAVTWRLIWKDERYLDGVIPDEEKEYLQPIEERAREVMRCDANGPCPRAGYWFTPAQSGSRRYFKDGEIMPSFNSTYGLTIWQWDENQNP